MSVRPDPRTDLRCTDCGYGIVTEGAAPPCPMCGGSAWEHLAWRPFTQRLDEALHAEITRDGDRQIQRDMLSRLFSEAAGRDQKRRASSSRGAN
jgi:predicted RNA-binding Zn-ribbon protein involved in translation (DUF1610 family)